MRTFAIGDIHGCSTLVDDLLQLIQPQETDLVVFLGDYVDRGPDSKGVIDRMIHLKRTRRVVTLRGNHEIMMLLARNNAEVYREWCRVGGLEALASYSPQPGRQGTLADVPPEHWDFLQHGCLKYFETATHIFVHAGVDPNVPLEEQDDGWLFWEFLSKPVKHYTGKTVIVGHSAQRSGEILDFGTITCIDTNAARGGWLTGLDVNSRQYWQVNLLGQRRQGVLGQPRAG